MTKESADTPDKREAATAHSCADEEAGQLSLRQMIGSALAAGLGVQSSANRKRDFTRGKAVHFIAIGVVFTALFVLGMVLFVRIVLSQAA